MPGGEGDECREGQTDVPVLKNQMQGQFDRRFALMRSNVRKGICREYSIRSKQVDDF